MTQGHGSRTSCPQPARGWHCRGYLPHLDVPGLIQFVTFHLADAVPSEQVERWREELGYNRPSSAADLQRKIEHYADAGHGSCVLKNPVCAEIVQNALKYFDHRRYRLLAWCIMPNHVHVLLEMTDSRCSLSRIVQSWKSHSARHINRQRGHSGRLWMPDYFDRYVRDDAHLAACLAYIHQNPVKAGLVDVAQDWPWSG